MSTGPKIVAGNSPFAHLANRTPSAAESDDDKKKKDEEAKKKAEEDDKKKKDEEAKKKAEEDDKKKKDEEAKKKADDDDGDRDDEDDAQARAARARERGRIRAIVTSEAGKANPVGAMHLACGTSMSRNQAIETLHAMGTPAAPARSDALRDRMSSVRQPDIGAGDESGQNADETSAVANRILAAGKKARGEAA